MKPTLKAFLKFLYVNLVVAFAAILFLEIGSESYQCPVPVQSPPPLRVCNPEYSPVVQSKTRTMQELVKAKRQSKEPAREDLDRVMNLESYENIAGLNGIACGNGMIFVRNDLVSEAKYFVARHQLEHVFRRNGINSDCSKEEYCATLEAAKAYPAGFLATVFSSLQRSYKESPTFWCFLFGSWSTFRDYVLP